MCMHLTVTYTVVCGVVFQNCDSIITSFVGGEKSGSKSCCGGPNNTGPRGSGFAKGVGYGPIVQMEGVG